MQYEEALQFFHSFDRFGVQPGLDRVCALSAFLGDPQDDLSFIHVAGTNGKGSTCTMLSEVFRAAGYTVGLYTSPYVLDFRERMQVNGQMISENELADLAQTVSDAVRKCNDNGVFPTEFEVVTAAAFYYFKQKKWDKDSGGPVDMKKVFYINNGVDLDFFNECLEKYSLDDEDLTQTEKKNIIYLGSIRLVNNLIQAIKAAEILKDRKDIQFLIYGDGDDRETLIEYCKDHHLDNVKFKAKWTDPKYVPFILTHSYLNLLNYVSSEFAKRGISSGKMFQYMASSRPIVCNINILHCPITANQIGIAQELKTPEEYANAIEHILSRSENDYKAMCDRAYKTAEQFDFKKLAADMARVIESL